MLDFDFVSGYPPGAHVKPKRTRFRTAGPLSGLKGHNSGIGGPPGPDGGPFMSERDKISPGAHQRELGKEGPSPGLSGPIPDLRGLIKGLRLREGSFTEKLRGPVLRNLIGPTSGLSV